MSKVDLTISIVSTDEARLLDKCLTLLFSGISKRVSFEVFVVNNLGIVKISRLIRTKYRTVKIIENDQRKGFSENHNQVIDKSSGKYVLVMNPDVFIEEGFIDNLFEAIEADKSIGIIMGKLIRSQEEAVIDSTGLVILKSRRTIDRGQGEKDRGQYDKSGEIFSASGAAMLCRRGMLEDIKLFGEYFDGSFRLYKEDLDLSWRARLRGWKVVYVPEAIAIHARGWGTDRSRHGVPRWIRRESYKNRYLLMIKNDHLINVLRDLPFILWHEVKALAYMIFREPHLFLAWAPILISLPLTFRKRAEIMKRDTVGAMEIRKWFI